MNVVPIRTSAGGILGLPVTPADVVDRCGKCLRTFREGDLYCAHLATADHTIARLDAGRVPAPADGPHRIGSALMPVFLAPGV